MLTASHISDYLAPSAASAIESPADCMSRPAPDIVLQALNNKVNATDMAIARVFITILLLTLILSI